MPPSQLLAAPVAMVRGRPAPAPLDAVEAADEAHDEAQHETEDVFAEAPPVKNTFIDYGPDAVLQAADVPLTAPGRLVGRANAAFQHLATPSAAQVVLLPQRSAVSDGGIPVIGGAATNSPPSMVETPVLMGHGQGPEGKKVISPPPMHTPHVRPNPDRSLLQAPPMMSPKIPKELSLGGFAGIPPPPQASPVVAGSPPRTFNLTADAPPFVPPTAPPSAPPSAPLSAPPSAPPAAAPIIRSDLCRARSSVGVHCAPPRCAPPSYMINMLQTPTGTGGYAPPPLHTPSCATPMAHKAVQLQPAVSRSTLQLYPGVAGCGRPPGEVASSGPLLWPATPF